MAFKKKNAELYQILSYKYRIYPNKKQIQDIYRLFNRGKNYYNYCLELMENVYKKYNNILQDPNHKSLKCGFVNANEVRLSANTLYNKDKFLASGTTDMLIQRVDAANKLMWTNYKKKGLIERPKFKYRVDSLPFRYRITNNITYPNGFKILDTHQNPNKWMILTLNHVDGNIKIRKDRPLPEKIHKYISMTLKKDNVDKWYIYIVFDILKTDLPQHVVTNKNVGIDAGIKTAFVMSDGEQIEKPQSMKKSEKKIKRLQTKINRRQKNPKSSNSRNRAKKALKKLYNKYGEQRQHWNHNVSRHIADNYDLIAIEKLNLIEMVSNNKNKKVKLRSDSKTKLNDIAIGRTFELLKYKAEGRVIEVNPKNTTQMCSQCGTIPKKKVELGDRIYKCETCGLVMDRDLNAAINIRNKAKI